MAYKWILKEISKRSFRKKFWAMATLYVLLWHCGARKQFRTWKLNYDSQLWTVLGKNIKQFKCQISHFKLGILLAVILGLFAITKYEIMFVKLLKNPSMLLLCKLNFQFVKMSWIITISSFSTKVNTSAPSVSLLFFTLKSQKTETQGLYF